MDSKDCQTWLNKHLPVHTQSFDNSRAHLATDLATTGSTAPKKPSTLVILKFTVATATQRAALAARYVLPFPRLYNCAPTLITAIAQAPCYAGPTPHISNLSSDHTMRSSDEQAERQRIRLAFLKFVVVLRELEWKEVNQLGDASLSDPLEEQMRAFEEEAMAIDRNNFLDWKKEMWKKQGWM